MVGVMWFFFFFKQKTAYEMRISDWSSDVCSSDLDFFRVSLEEDRIELVSELIDHPVLKAANVLSGLQLPAEIAEHAERGTKNPQLGQGFESPQRVAVEFALIIDAAHAGTLNEVVRQDHIPAIHYLF